MDFAKPYKADPPTINYAFVSFRLFFKLLSGLLAAFSFTYQHSAHGHEHLTEATDALFRPSLTNAGIAIACLLLMSAYAADDVLLLVRSSAISSPRAGDTDSVALSAVCVMPGQAITMIASLGVDFVSQVSVPVTQLQDLRKQSKWIQTREKHQMPSRNLMSTT